MLQSYLFLAYHYLQSCLFYNIIADIFATLPAKLLFLPAKLIALPTKLKGIKTVKKEY